MKYHQNLTIDGQDIPAEYPNRKGSAFFNEGKWRNFIAPLLPLDPTDMTFLEVGCNAGLFLRLAAEHGFRRVVGVEADPAACAMAERYRDAHGLGYKVLNRAVGQDFDWDEMPCADVVLLANMHYYVPLDKFLPFLDRMRWKARTCVVVSRAMRDKKHGHPLPDEASLRLYFRDWECLRKLDTSTKMLQGDPHPRRVFSLLFQSQLQRQPIGDHARPARFYPKQQELIDLARAGEEWVPEDSLTWRYWVQRKQTDKAGRKDRWSDEEVRAHVQHRLCVVRDIMENGMKEPILVRPDRVGIDGGNRASILRLLGHGSILVRVV